MKSFITSFSAGIAAAFSARGESLVPWPAKVRTAFPGVVGSLTTMTALGITAAPKVRLRHTPLIAAGIAGVSIAGWFYSKKKLSEIAAEGAALDPGLLEPPKSPLVSGGADSEVNYLSLGREGARFIHGVTLDAVLPDAPRVTEPIRVFVSVLSTESVQDRISMAMRELQRTGAFDRAYLMIQSPAGSGYANSTPVDVLELLSGGDCASVVVSYGLLPSFLSLRKVKFAGETQRALLEAINAELDARERNSRSIPQVLLYGESLGARVQQYALPLGLVDLDRFRISRALWVGTPGGVVADGFHLLCSSDSITVDRPEQIPPDRDARVWFLEHDGDPVVRFRPDLSWSRPEWLNGQPRGRNIPDSMSWRPGLTWATVLVDTIFATNVKPGDFQSWGHDYRADLGEVTARAFGFRATSEQMASLQSQLREYEVARAQRISGASAGLPLVDTL